MRLVLGCAGFAGAAMLSACSGGGTPSPPPPPPPPPPANAVPVFTSSATATVDENILTPAYRATATDTDGNPITYSISGGIDSADFTINGTTGDVSFVTPPDFDSPADANTNNVYQLTVAASDGTAQTTLPVSITVRDILENIQVRRRATGFSEPVFVTGAGDNSGRLFVAQKSGLIRILNPNTGVINATPFLDVSASILTAAEQGLLGLAFAPNYATSGVFYVYVIGSSGSSEVRRYTVSGDPNVANAGGDVILTFTQTGAGNHKAGWIGFGNDGLLYIASGDGGGNTSTTNPAQNTSSFLGKILRVDVSADDFAADPNRDYRIPFSNPFSSGVGGAPEVFAYGLRNPFRASVDPVSGTLYIGDVGEGTREEIDILPQGASGRNFGWVRFEGTSVFNASATAPGAVAPVLQYLHGSGPSEGNSVTGGVVNRGPVEALENDYIFGDFISGNIFSVPIENLAQGTTLTAGQFVVQTTAFAPDAGAIDNISSFGTDDVGNVYIVDYDGEIFRLEEM